MDIYYNFGSWMLLAKIYYEQGVWDVFEVLLKVFQVFLRCNWLIFIKVKIFYVSFIQLIGVLLWQLLVFYFKLWVKVEVI